MDSLLEHFASYITVSPALAAEITARVRIKAFSKGEMVHHARNICRESYFVQKGIMRLYFVRDDKEITDFFGAEGEWVNSPRSMMFRKTDHYFIDTLEDCEVLVLATTDLGYLFDHFPEMERYARLSMGSMFYQFMERITSLRFSTAAEKYAHFLEVYHDIHHRLPLGMIASYLGITQETLSRVRAR